MVSLYYKASKCVIVLVFAEVESEEEINHKALSLQVSVYGFKEKNQSKVHIPGTSTRTLPTQNPPVTMLEL